MKKILLLSILIIGFSNAYSQLRYDNGGITNSNNFVTRGNWGRNDITFSFANGTNDIAGNDERIAVRQAFQLWADYGNLNFTEVTTGGDIDISWAVGDHGDGTPFDGQNGVLAHAFFPPPINSGNIAGDMHFDDAEIWTNVEQFGWGQPIDLVTVAAHEIGHSLGLDHSNEPCALMNPFYRGSHRYLAQDDIDGIQSLYGNRTTVRSANNFGCASGNLFINHLPNGATVNWTSSNNLLATITTVNNQGSYSRINNANGLVRFTGTITLPCGTTVIEFVDIFIGTGTQTFMLNNVYFHPSPVPKIPSLIFNLEVSQVPAATSYKVYLNNVPISPQSSAGGYVPPGFVQLGGYKLPKCGVKYNLRVEALTPCGTMTVSSTNFQQKCSGLYQQRFAATTHPTLTNTLMIGVRQFSEDELAKLFFDATTLANEQVQAVRVIDKEGNVVLDVSNIGTQLTNIDLSTLAEGIYNIEVYGNNDYKEQQTYEYAVTKTPQQIEEELAANILAINSQDAAKLNEVLQQELYQKIAENTDLTNNSTILQNFMLTQELGKFGTIEKINNALYEYDVATAQMLINNWLPTTNLELNCLQYYNNFIKYLNGGTFTNNDLIDLYGLANLCPQKNGEIIYAARSLYNYVTQLDETFSTACGNNLARGYTKIDAKAKLAVSSISIYPNPSKGNFSVKFPSTSRGINTVKVLDTYGKTIMQQSVISGTQNININKTLASGIYTVQITNSITGKTETQKLIINN
jgi:Matrixin/Secretion system C-terminal sorting domain